jgi:ankyrin repeat protein
MKTTLGSTALHTALLGGKNDIIKILLEAGANVNNILMHGRTPLHLPAASGNISVMTLLLQYGADPHQRDDSGNSAIEIARRYGHVAAVEILRPSLGSEGKSFQPQVPCIFTEANLSSIHPITIPHRSSFEAQLRAEAKEDEAVFKLAVQDHCDMTAAKNGRETADAVEQHAFNYFDWEHY